MIDSQSACARGRTGPSWAWPAGEAHAGGHVRVPTGAIQRRYPCVIRVRGDWESIIWPKLKLIVELDSYRYHSSRHAWEQDRRRERETHARGDAFRRYTYGDVIEHPGPMLRELRELLPPV